MIRGLRKNLKLPCFPPEPVCLNVQAIPALKPTPALQVTINQFHTKLINGRVNLFFVAFESKWRLVGVTYKDTMSFHPDCIQDGKVLVDFYPHFPPSCQSPY